MISPGPNTDAPFIPREAWRSHPHFASQALLLGSHANFRRLNRYLIDEAGKPGAELASLRHLYVRWISAMRSHEAYEERKLYPFLTRRWSVSFDAATAGHRALHEAYDAVIEAFVASLAGARATVVAALERHELVLIAHLELEEDLVIPLLLALDAAEFEDYSSSSIAVR